MSNVLYETARGPDGSIKHIKDRDVLRGKNDGRLRCLGCGSIMIARRGTQNQWHFAHEGDAPQDCTPSMAFHNTAVRTIVDSFNQAVETGNEYHLGIPCTNCTGQISHDFAKSGYRAEAEKAAIKGTRSDIIIRRPDKDTVIIEVVNTHDIEDGTVEKYTASRYPVLKVFIGQEGFDLDSLKTGVKAHDMLNRPDGCRLCDVCKEAEQESIDAHDWVGRIMSLMTRGPANGNDGYAVVADRNGWPFPEKLISKIKYKCVHLKSLGFKQRNHAKPHLFSYFAAPDKTVFVDFGDCHSVDLYVSVYMAGDSIRDELLVEEVARRLEYCRVEVHSAGLIRQSQYAG